jgi:tRNA A37 threonylcarbamoyladenosine dehydratase
MEEAFSRTAMLLTETGVQRLQQARVIVFGLGGVGGTAAEALARAGIGTLGLVDNDTVSISNLNRQVIALHSTIGQFKTQVAGNRIAEINPHVRVREYRMFYLPETADRIDLTEYDYIVDAIDTVTAKLELITRAKAAGIPVISCMGTGNRIDPGQLQIIDLSKTTGCPLARVMRRELRRRGIEHLPVVCSREEAIVPRIPPQETGGHPVPGSVSFVPPVAGMLAAGAVIRAIALNEQTIFGNPKP